MKEYGFVTDVSFRFGNILLLNGKQIETPDHTPEDLRAQLAAVSLDICVELERLEHHDREYRPTSSRFLRPIVLVARLALTGQEDKALSRNALHSRQHHITHPDLLTAEAFTYWNSIDTETFQPQAHVIKGVDKDSAGVWLGVNRAYPDEYQPLR
jgi:hypothetical protein